MLLNIVDNFFPLGQYQEQSQIVSQHLFHSKFDSRQGRVRKTKLAFSEARIQARLSNYLRNFTRRPAAQILFDFNDNHLGGVDRANSLCNGINFII